MLEKQIEYTYGLDKDMTIEVRRTIIMVEDGKELTRFCEGYSIQPGVDCSKEDVKTKELALKLHTPEVVADYKTKMAELEAASEITK